MQKNDRDGENNTEKAAKGAQGRQIRFVEEGVKTQYAMSSMLVSVRKKSFFCLEIILSIQTLCELNRRLPYRSRRLNVLP